MNNTEGKEGGRGRFGSGRRGERESGRGGEEEKRMGGAGEGERKKVNGEPGRRGEVEYLDTPFFWMLYHSYQHTQNFFIFLKCY